MTTIILVTVVAMLLASGLAYALLARASSGLPEVRIEIGDTQVRAELAASALARARGLSYRDELADGRGMLFSFGSASRRSFWMNGMRFPIDIVWLRHGVVVDITANVDPQIGASMTSLRSYAPSEPADEVLELPAGYAAAHDVKKGSRMVLLDDE